MDIAKIRHELGWEPGENFDGGLPKTVSWYLGDRWWWEPIWSQRYLGERLGTAATAFRLFPTRLLIDNMILL
jgi:dTDP-glucose 4,6-dehydratase